MNLREIITDCDRTRSMDGPDSRLYKKMAIRCHNIGGIN